MKSVIFFEVTKVHNFMKLQCLVYQKAWMSQNVVLFCFVLFFILALILWVRTFPFSTGVEIRWYPIYLDYQIIGIL